MSDHVPTPEQLDESWDETDDRIVDLIREARHREREIIMKMLSELDPRWNTETSGYCRAIRNSIVLIQLRDNDQNRTPAMAKQDQSPASGR